MWIINRSVSLIFALLAVAVAVFVAMLVHELQVRSDEISHYGTALPARVTAVGKSKTVGGFLFISGSTYTKASVEVTTRSGAKWDYDSIDLGGHPVVGQGLQAWFYDRDPDQAFFSNLFDTGNQQSYAVPWPSVGNQIAMAFNWSIVGAIVALIFLGLLSSSRPEEPAVEAPHQPSTPPARDWEWPMADS